MIVEERCYSIVPGRLNEFLEMYANGPSEVQRRIQGNLLGYFTTEIGPLSSIVNLWGYESLDDRTRRRSELFADPVWREFMRRCTPLIQKMENRILLPAAFSPIR